jgi:hypothetical protein
MQLQDNYFFAHRSLKLTRDADGVLVAEFHRNDGPFTLTAQDHTEFVDPFYRIAGGPQPSLARKAPLPVLTHCSDLIPI